MYRTWTSLRNSILRLNLFKTPNTAGGDAAIHRQQMVTRLYLILLVGILLIFAFHTAVSQQTFTKTIKNPSESTYFLLESSYPYSLHCPCSRMSIDYESILTIQPLYYPICTSDLISTQWIQLLRDNYRPVTLTGYPDFLSIGATMFQSLAILCETAKATINTSLQAFFRRRLVTAEVLSKDLFEAQLNVATDQWQRGITYDLTQMIDLFRAHSQGNQFLSDNYNVQWYVPSGGTIYFVFDFFLTDSFSLDYCSCALSSQCNETLPLYDEYRNLVMIEGLIVACTPITALTLSDLRLFYNKSFIDWLFAYLPNNRQSFSLNTLSLSNQSSPNETIQSMVNQSFVQQWFIDVSFSNYYRTCAPQSCTYQTIHRPDFILIVMTIIAVFGGLSTSLKILMQMMLFLLGKYRARCSYRLLQTWIANFFDYQRLENRLTIVLISASMVALYFSYALRKYEQINDIAVDPSYQLYLHLTTQYSNDALQCPCSQVSIPYDLFINITVVSYHQICSKPFLRYPWLSYYLPKLMMGVYEPNSFDDLIPTYLQIIAEFCDTSRTTIQHQLTMFLTDNLIESFPNPSPTHFQSLMEDKIELFKLKLARSVIRTLELLREMTHINQLLSIFGSNWRFYRATLSPELSSSNDSDIHMFPVNYGTCDCGLSKSCVTQMTQNDGINVTGLMVGCYPLEALLQSTLECFYQRICFQLIRDISYYPFDVTRLLLNSSSPSQFPINATVQHLLEGLFVEKWSTSVSHEQYYQACAPSSCSYSSLRSPTGVEIATDLLGLYGGLTIIIERLVVPLLIGLFWRCVRPFHRIHSLEA